MTGAEGMGNVYENKNNLETLWLAFKDFKWEVPISEKDNDYQRPLVINNRGLVSWVYTKDVRLILGELSLSSWHGHDPQKQYVLFQSTVPLNVETDLADKLKLVVCCIDDKMALKHYFLLIIHPTAYS